MVVTVGAAGLMLAGSPAAHAAEPQRPVHHRVQAGESLWGIARAFLTEVQGRRPSAIAVKGEARTIYALNRATIGPDPAFIRAGQRLLLSHGASWGDIADGQPGWGGSFTSCVDERPPARSTAPHPGMSFRLSLPSTTLPQGRSIRGTWTVHNGSSTAADFATSSATGNAIGAVVVDSLGRAVGEVTSSDAILNRVWHLAPGATKTGAVRIRLRSCADTEPLPPQALTPGRYRVIATMTWSRSPGGSYDFGDWATPAVVLRVSPRRA